MTFLKVSYQNFLLIINFLFCMKILSFEFIKLSLISFYNNFIQTDMQINSNYICIFNVNNILCIFDECVNLFIYNILADKLDVVIFFIVKIEESNIILIKIRILVVITVYL